MVSLCNKLDSANSSTENILITNCPSRADKSTDLGSRGKQL